MVSYEQKINTIWHEWKSGEYEQMKGLLFLSAIFDKVDDHPRIRLVFEQDLLNQQIINVVYDRLPEGLGIVFDAIGKKVFSVVAEGEQDRVSYVVTFEDGYWFRV